MATPLNMTAKNRLGSSDIEVSPLCLGTMTWPTHTDTEQAHRQMDMALDAGINFIDTAELYPVNPVLTETVGMTEETLGSWFTKTGRRSDWVLATKICGIGSPARDGEAISPTAIKECVETSLRRLQTDYIDLYQLHWPNRGHYAFRNNWDYRPDLFEYDKNQIEDEFDACLEVLQHEVERGTIRSFGLSNETTWGTMQWLRAAQRTGGPRVISIQNEYSLLHRLADTDLAEMMFYEQISLLPYSPLAAGLISGKYAGGRRPEGSRAANGTDLGGRITQRSELAVEAYTQVAEDHGLDVLQMAVAYAAQRPFVASAIFGATTVEQCERILPAMNLELDAGVIADIERVHKEHPMPF